MRTVDVRGIKPGTEGITYCGRAWAGWEASPLGNPFRKGYCKHCNQIHPTPSSTIPCYRVWLLTNVVQENPVVMQAMRSLNKDSVLGCWCKDKTLCHCGVIEEVWNRFFGEDNV